MDTFTQAINKLDDGEKVEFLKEYIIKAGMAGSNHFEGVPMKIIIDYITINLIDGLRLDTQFREPFDAHLFRLIVDRAVWKAKEQIGKGKWHAESKRT